MNDGARFELSLSSGWAAVPSINSPSWLKRIRSHFHQGPHSFCRPSVVPLQLLLISIDNQSV